MSDCLHFCLSRCTFSVWDVAVSVVLTYWQASHNRTDSVYSHEHRCPLSPALGCHILSTKLSHTVNKAIHSHYCVSLCIADAKKPPSSPVLSLSTSTTCTLRVRHFQAQFLPPHASLVVLHSGHSRSLWAVPQRLNCLFLGVWPFLVVFSTTWIFFF